MNFDAVKRVLTAFEAEGVDYVVFGAAAINLLGLARATEDLDVFVGASPENIERLKTALRSVFDDPHIDEITAEDLLGDYPSVQYVPPDGSFYLDILARLGEVYRFDNIASQRVDFEGRAGAPRTVGGGGLPRLLGAAAGAWRRSIAPSGLRKERLSP